MTVWLTDRNGAQVDDTSPETVQALLESLHGISDDEHGSISATDEAGWNLEFYEDSVLLENVEPGGSVVGTLSGLTDDARARLAAMLIAGDIDALRAQEWSSADE